MTRELAFAVVGTTGMVALGLFVATCWRVGSGRAPALGVGFLALSWVAAMLLLATDVLGKGPPLLLVVPALLVAAAAAGVGYVLLRHGVAWVLLPVAIAAAPLRVTIRTGDDDAQLLLGLYGVLGLAAATAFVHLLRGGRVPVPVERRSAAWLAAPLCLLAMLAAASVAWSQDADAAATDLTLFWIPFALLGAVTATMAPLSARAVPASLGALVAVMTASAVIGLWQYGAREVWANPKVITANAFSPAFRTNSIFWDPNIYGRYLVVSLLVLAAVLTLRRMSPRMQLGCLGLFLLQATALWFSWSNSSFAALAAGSAVLLGCQLRRRPAVILAVAAVVAATAAVPLLLAGSLFEQDGRVALARGGMDMVRERPLQGVGLGAFEQAYGQLAAGQSDDYPRLRSSHTTPVTVATELGLPGLLLLLAVLGASLVHAARLGRVRLGMVGCWALAAWIALFVHSLLYASLLEDPLTWFALALLLTVARPRGAPLEPADVTKAQSH